MGLVRRSGVLVAAVVLAAMFASTSCASPHGRLYVRVGPPAPIVETRVVAPGPGYVWLPGFYSWNGASYVWVPGRWERPARARAVWGCRAVRYATGAGGTLSKGTGGDMA